MAQNDAPQPIDLKDAHAVVVVSPVRVTLPKEAAAAGGEPGQPEPGDKPVVSQHRLDLGEETIDYTATAGTLTLTGDDGKARARMFYVAYTRDGVKDPATRPVTFTFNGGPGSSSVWLHLGAFGPLRVCLPDDAAPPAPPYTLADNPWSLLDVTDLVFIDPVSTGYSRAAPDQDAKQFHGVTGDVESVGEFIRLWCTRQRRWPSPKFLAGESYGTTRAANLANHLQERHGLFASGVVLISSVLHFNTLHFSPDNDLPHVVYLPAYTATAWYHGRLAPDLQGDGSPRALRAALTEAEAFALGEYAEALLLGTRLPAARQRRVAARLARLTGLSRDFVTRANLRVSIGRFVKELCRADGRTVGRLDTRYVGRDRDAAGESFEYDPSYSAIQGPFTAALNHHVRAGLGYENDLPYEILTDRVHPWRFDTAENKHLDVAEPLRQAMTRNPHLKVFVANGYYDLATPYFATEHTFHHLGLDPALAANVTMAHYEAGHMMYIHGPSHAALKADLAAFYHAAAVTPAEAAEQPGRRKKRGKG
jgi:carboxypeptidase C (cathepsin A)